MRRMILNRQKAEHTFINDIEDQLKEECAIFYEK